MSKTIRLTSAQALVRYLSAQLTEEGTPFIAGVWAIFGHGNVAGLGEALHASRETLPTWRGHNEQTMAHAAIADAPTNTTNNTLPTDMQVIGAVQRAAHNDTVVMSAAGTMPGELHKLW